MASAPDDSFDQAAAAAIAEAQSWLEAHPVTSDTDRKAWLRELVDSGWSAPSWPVEEYGRGLAPKVARATDQVFRPTDLTGWGQDVTNLWAATITTWARPETQARDAARSAAGRGRYVFALQRAGCRKRLGIGADPCRT